MASWVQLWARSFSLPRPLLLSVRPTGQLEMRAALQIGLRPVLFASRPHETVQKINWETAIGCPTPGRAVLEENDGVIYMAMSLQTWLGYRHSARWRIEAGERISPQASLEEMRATAMQIRPDPPAFVHKRGIVLTAGRSQFLASRN